MLRRLLSIIYKIRKKTSAAEIPNSNSTEKSLAKSHRKSKRKKKM